jgi:hypothetical protein
VAANVSSEPNAQKGKVQHVISELKVSEMPIPANLRQSELDVVRKCIDAFMAKPDDFGRKIVVVAHYQDVRREAVQAQATPYSLCATEVPRGRGRTTSRDWSNLSCGSRKVPVLV